MALTSSTSPLPRSAAGRDLAGRYRAVRARTKRLAAPLSAEDQTAQSMPDASPVKWHLAHTTWFFETFVLARDPTYRPVDPTYGFLFNSYYESLGPRQARPARGLLTRPSADAVFAYREQVDEAMERVLGATGAEGEVADLVSLGLAHEEQHQELILTDVLHLLAQNPLQPAYDPGLAITAKADIASPEPLSFISFQGGLVEIGVSANAGAQFHFDNEGPRHQVYLRPFRLADRLTTNQEWLEFMEAGGYDRAEFWLSEGWTLARSEGWRAPLYWRATGEGWETFSLAGTAPIEPCAPVTHVSYYEADAYARWRGLRLATEAEWEHAAANLPVAGNFADEGPLRPQPSRGAGVRQLFGDCWEWTASSYSPYPGFMPAQGAVGEYNGKFMINQMVLRGGSCATPPNHVSASYRNFFHPHQRWQFSGVRLASDGSARASGTAIVDAGFRQDVMDGLSAPQKSVPSKYFYDAAGSALFEAICELEVYYPTRVETALLRAVAPDLANAMPSGGALIEFGSGSSVKTRILLEAATALRAYAPVDISASAVQPAADAIARDFPHLLVAPVVGDFTRRLVLPPSLGSLRKTAFFPGSTIGNFPPAAAAEFMARVRSLVGEGGAFIVGVDMVKDEKVLVAAYDDPEGVTRDFNLNLLRRINRELGGEFDLSAFAHRAIFNTEESRIEMHIVSLRDQVVFVGSRSFAFARGETIHTENSYKYTPERFQALAEKAGWRMVRRWVAPQPSFAVFLLSA